MVTRTPEDLLKQRRKPTSPIAASTGTPPDPNEVRKALWENAFSTWFMGQSQGAYDEAFQGVLTEGGNPAQAAIAGQQARQPITDKIREQQRQARIQGIGYPEFFNIPLPSDVEVSATITGMTGGVPPAITPGAQPTIPAVGDASLARLAQNWAIARGINPRANWLLKLTEDPISGEPSISYTLPNRWEITEEGYISPEGIPFSDEEYEQTIAQIGLAEMEAILAEFYPDIILAPEGVSDEAATSLGMMPRGELEDFLVQQGELGVERFAQFQERIKTVYPDRDVEEIIGWLQGSDLKDLIAQGEGELAAEEIQVRTQSFLDEIRKAGRNEDTVGLLRSFFPQMAEEQIESVFADPEVTIYGVTPLEQAIPTYEEWVAKREEGFTVRLGPLDFKIKWPWTKISREEYDKYVETLSNIPVYQRAFITGVGSLVQSAVGAATWMGADGLAEEIQETGLTDLLVYQVPDDDPNNLTWQDVWVGAWQAAPFTLALLPAFILGTAAGLGGAAALGVTGFVRTLIGVLGGTLASVPLESAMEAGNTYDMALRQGMTPDEAHDAAQQTFENNLKLLGVTNYAQLLTFLAPGGKILNSLMKKGLTRVAMIGGQLTFQGLTEAGEEFFQDRIQREALGLEVVWDDEAKLATIIGAMFGVGFGGAGVLYQSIVNRFDASLTPELKVKFDDAKRVALAEGKTEEEATVIARGVVAETAEGKKILTTVVDGVKIDEYEKAVKPKTKADELAFQEYFKQQREALELEEVARVEVKKAELEAELEDAQVKLLGKQAELETARFEESQGDITRLTSEIRTLTDSGASSRQELERIAPEVIAEPIPEDIKEGGTVGAQAFQSMRERVANSIWEESGGRGFYKDKASLSQHLDTLSDTEIKKLYNRYVLKLVKPLEMVEAESRAKYAERTGMPKGYLEDAINKKSGEELNQLAHNELFIPIKDSPHDVAMTEYLRTEDFEAMARLFPRVDELKLKALGDTVLKNMDELNEAIEGIQAEIVSVEVQQTRGQMSKRELKETDRSIAILKDDIARMELMIKDLRGGKEFTVDNAAALGIALRETKTGKIVPALRDSGFYANEEFANSPYLQDISYVWGQWEDITTMFQNIDGGVTARLQDDSKGVAQKYILWPADHTDLAGMRFEHKYQDEIHVALDKFNMLGKQPVLVKVIEWITSREASFKTKTLLAMPEIKKLVGEYSAEEQTNIAEAAQWVRAFTDNVIRMENVAREARRQPLIKYRKGYLPSIMDISVWNRLGITGKTTADIMQKPPLPDFIHPNQPFNPREQARKGGIEEIYKETNVQKLLFDLIHNAKKDIFFTGLIHNTKIHTAVMRARGLDNSARLIEDWVSEAYAGTTSHITRGIEAAMPRKLRRGIFLVRRNLTRAVFPFNIKWNMTIQPSSVVFTLGRAGFVASAKGVDVFFTADALKQASATHAAIIKSARSGKMSMQDISDQIGRNDRYERSILDNVEIAGNFLLNKIEKWVTLYSVRAGHHLGIRKGFKGRALQEFASNMGAQTQSMYNIERRPAILRSRLVTSFFPFMTFILQAFNFVRTTFPFLSRRMRTGAYMEVGTNTAEGTALFAQRMKLFLGFIAGIVAINMVVDRLTGRKPWVVGSFVPFYSILQGVTDPTNPWNSPLPDQYVVEFWDAFEALIKYENWDKLRKWFVRYQVPGGTQANRIIDTLIAMSQGKVTDVRGKPLFEVNTEEWVKSFFMGPYSTEGGQEYIDKIRGDEDFWMTWFGLVVPEKVNINDEVDSLTDNLGTLDTEGIAFDFGDLVSGLRAIRIRVGDNLFDKSDNPLIVGFRQADTYSDEMGERIKDWRDEDLSDNEVYDKRDEWRRANPEVDAFLALYAYSGRIQTMEAYNMVLELAKGLDISMDYLATFLPPENIAPDYFSYADMMREGISGSSTEARFFRLVRPDFDAWGQEAYGWKPVDEKLKETFPTDAVAELSDRYEALRKPDDTADTAARKAFRIANPTYDAWGVANGKFTKTLTGAASRLDKSQYLEWYRLEKEPTKPTAAAIIAPPLPPAPGVQPGGDLLEPLQLFENLQNEGKVKPPPPEEFVDVTQIAKIEDIWAMYFSEYTLPIGAQGLLANVPLAMLPDIGAAGGRYVSGFLSLFPNLKIATSTLKKGGSDALTITLAHEVAHYFWRKRTSNKQRGAFLELLRTPDYKWIWDVAESTVSGNPQLYTLNEDTILSEAYAMVYARRWMDEELFKFYEWAGEDQIYRRKPEILPSQPPTAPQVPQTQPPQQFFTLPEGSTYRDLPIFDDEVEWMPSDESIEILVRQEFTREMAIDVFNTPFADLIKGHTSEQEAELISKIERMLAEFTPDEVMFELYNAIITFGEETEEEVI